MKHTPDSRQKAVSFCRTALCYVKDGARIEFRTREVAGQAGYDPRLLTAIEALEDFLGTRSEMQEQEKALADPPTDTKEA